MNMEIKEETVTKKDKVVMFAELINISDNPEFLEQINEEWDPKKKIAVQELD